MNGKWQKERPEWFESFCTSGFATLKGSTMPMVISRSVDISEAWDGIAFVRCENIEWWWSEPIEVPPMPTKQ